MDTWGCGAGPCCRVDLHRRDLYPAGMPHGLPLVSKTSHLKNQLQLKVASLDLADSLSEVVPLLPEHPQQPEHR